MPADSIHLQAGNMWPLSHELRGKVQAADAVFVAHCFLLHAQDPLNVCSQKGCATLCT